MTFIFASQIIKKMKKKKVEKFFYKLSRNQLIGTNISFKLVTSQLYLTEKLSKLAVVLCKRIFFVSIAEFNYKEKPFYYEIRENNKNY